MTSLAAATPLAVAVGGERRAGTGAPLELHDPSTGMRVARFAAAGPADVDAAVTTAAGAFRGEWSAVGPAERGRMCRRVGQLISEREQELVEIGMRDAGLPTSLARRDVAVAARYFEYYGSLAESVGGETLPVDRTVLALTIHEPWGVCAIVLPFNFPLQLAARDLAPALAMGNTAVLKPAEVTPLGPLALVAVCEAAGVPAGVVNAIVGDGASVGAPLVRHEGVAHITFTGSRPSGVRVMAAAAERILPTTIELGGKSPHVVFADAPMEDAVAAIVAGCMRPAGQACSAGTRVLVEHAAHEELRERLATVIRQLRLGPAPDDPDVGPLASARQRDAVASAVAASEAAGARVVVGGGAPSGGRWADGYFVEPTLLDRVAPEASAAQEEIFGPVLALLPFGDERDAVALANGTPYGLVAGVWTRDGARALRVANRIDAGQVFVNGYGVGGGVELPFGGYKRSGVGRTKGREGALEYTQLKTVCLALT